MGDHPAAADAIISKGTYLQLDHFTVSDDGAASENHHVLIPSWVAGGLFTDDDGPNDGSEATHHKRRKRKHADESSGQYTSRYGNLEELIAHEIRNCDACGRHVLWSTSTHQSYFGSHCDDKAAKATSSIADSLPQFVGKYISSKLAIPCTFCAEAYALKDKQTYSWCGSLYCSNHCRNRGEYNQSRSEFADSKPYVPSPKLFFCRNRMSKSVGAEEKIDIQEAIDSLNTIKRRLGSICGASSSLSRSTLQTVGLEECALLVTTLMCCSCHWRAMDLLEMHPKTKQHRINLDPSEEGPVEEMWVMSRSHWSLIQSVRQLADIEKDRQFPSYQDFLRLYNFTKRSCLITVSPSTHPLVSYTTKILLSSKELNDFDRDNALNTLQIPSCDDQSSTNTDLNIESAIRIWRRATHFSHWLSSSTSEQHQDVQLRLRSHLNKPYYVFSSGMLSELKHSCAPTLMMTMYDGNLADMKGDNLKNLVWLTLHDMEKGDESISMIDSLDADIETRGTALKRLLGGDYVCSCERCQYESNANEVSLTTRQLKRLGDIAMQASRFQDAASIYDTILNIDACNADAFHAKAASFLGRASSVDFAKLGHCQGFFIEAQKLWSQATTNDSLAIYSDISVILQKQSAYGTIQDIQISISTSGENNGDSSSGQYPCSSYLKDKVFLLNAPIISVEECRQVIKSAASYANQTGWTTSRHYAVPTTDIPLHELVDLKPWFYDVWSQRIRPLLRRQFKINDAAASPKARDIFIHDAFVVRYDAMGGQRNLPPHYDESTHSFIIALNTDYEGGGTYIHKLNQALKPLVAGGMISFCGGELLHSGDSVVNGIRYVIVAFCYIDLIKGYEEQEKCEKQEGTIMGQSSGASSGFSFGFTF